MTTGPFDQQHTGGGWPAAEPPQVGSHPGTSQAGSSPQWWSGAPGPAVAELWLDPGPALPRRSWQRRSRRWVIAASTIGAAILATIGILALLVGFLLSSSFDAKGSVLVDCATKTAAAPGGVVAAGTPVRIYDERGNRVGSTELGSSHGGDDRCSLPFEVTGLDSTGGPYLVQVGDVFSQTVTESALSAGVVLRPV